VPKRVLWNWFTHNESNLLNIILWMNEHARTMEIKVENLLPKYQFDRKEQKPMMDIIRKKRYKESKKLEESLKISADKKQE
jgi:hypothetical protein